MTEDAQVKSKARVAAHGEVFTAPREVNAMLDLVRNETERIDSRFLEPACGNGNFLAAILERKLDVCDKIYGKSAADWEKFSFVAVSSIYGVDILADNVAECRARLFGIWEARWRRWERRGEEAKKRSEGEEAKKRGSEAERTPLHRAIAFLLARNILCGNALSMLEVDAAGHDIPGRAIVFSEWSFVTGSKVKRRDFKLAALLTDGKDSECSFLSPDGSAMVWNEERKAFIPAPIREFDLVDYWAIGENEAKKR